MLDRPPHRLLQIIGGAALLCALLANPYVLGRLFAPDGVIDYPPNLLAIVIFEVMLAAVGCILWRHSVGVSGFLAALADWMSGGEAESAPGEFDPGRDRACGLSGAMALEARKPVARWEWLALGAVCIGCLVFWIAQYHPFVLPNADFLSFERTSRQLLGGHLPTSYKRMPAFPLLIGAVGKVIRADRPELEAALVLNMGLSVGSLVLLFALTRRLIGWPAIVLTAFYGTSYLFNHWAVQPLLEPCLGFFVLLSFFLFHKRSKWQYAAAFAAAATRYEASALIAIFFVLNWARERRFWKHTLLAGLASTGFVAWMALSALHTKGDFAHGSGANPYLVHMQKMGWAMAPSFVVTLLRESLGIVGLIRIGRPLLIFACCAIFALLAGLWLSFRLWRRESLAFLLFVLLYTGVHVAFGVGISRYVYPVQWILPFYGLLGLTTILWIAGRSLRAFWRPSVGHVLAAATTGLSGWSLYVLFSKLAAVDGCAPAAAYVALAALALSSVVFCSVMRYRRPISGGLALGLALVSLMAWPAGAAMERHARRSWKVYYDKYQHFLIGEWLKANLRPGEKAVVIHKNMVTWSNGMVRGRIRAFSSLQARNHEEMIAELAAHEVSYVVYSYRRARKGNPEEMYRYRNYRAFLAEPFRDGADMPNFRRVETLHPPEVTNTPPAHIYRFAPGDASRRE